MLTADFPHTREVTYLDTAAEGLPPIEVQEALVQYARDKGMGTPGRRALYEMERKARQSVAQMLGADMGDVALLGSASDGLNLLANSMEWRAGDEVLLSDLEFPSNVLAWLRLRDRGVKVRVIPTRGGAMALDEYTTLINSRTKLVSVSQVSYKTGAQACFLGALSEEAHRAGAILCVDATQALGRVPVSIEGVDFLVASAYKWLLGVHGTAVVYLSEGLRRRLAPGAVGWHSVTDIFTPDRFERYELKAGAGWMVAGMPNFPGVYALKRSAGYLLRARVERFDISLQPLVARLRNGLASLGLDLLTPPGPECASGIVAFEHPRADAIGRALDEERVIVWAGDGRVRASLHLYNDEDDVRRYLDVLKSILEAERV